MLMLSRRNLESLSRRALHTYLQQKTERLECIDPVDFAEKMCGLRFEFAEMPASTRMIGLTSFGTIDIKIHSATEPVQVFKLDGKTAYIDQRLAANSQTGRLNFTMMHEAAHQLLALFFPQEYNFEKHPVICRLAEERCSRPITNWVEWQTNVLASCLLLPKELVRKQMSLQGFGERIRLLNRVFAPKDYERFSEMADQLGVSKTALVIRLTQLNMIERNDFHDPYALVNVYADEGEVA